MHLRTGMDSGSASITCILPIWVGLGAKHPQTVEAYRSGDEAQNHPRDLIFGTGTFFVCLFRIFGRF